MLLLRTPFEGTRMDHKAKALELIGTVAGGGLAGLLDVETPDKMPAGLPLGAWAGLGLVGLGFAASKSKGTMGKIANASMDLGTGALSFEAGSAVVSRVLKAKAAAATAPAVAGLPGPRPHFTQESLRQNIARARVQR